jgi:hypothetical protein
LTKKLEAPKKCTKDIVHMQLQITCLLWTLL